VRVIKSLGSANTERLFNRERVRQFEAFERQAQRKLTAVHAAVTLGDLAAIPGNHLEMLRGSRTEQYSIRINNKWRVCFVWKDNDAYDVEITDYRH
jgi:proteic killer suppression protein